MSPTSKRNVGHSVFQRLKNQAGPEYGSVQLLLARYAVERFLYRLVRSEHKDSFVLKGASLFLVWDGEYGRVTRDVDLLGYGSSNLGVLEKTIRQVCMVEIEHYDGLEFDLDSLLVEEIRDGQEYGGVRLKVDCSVHNARTRLQIDIGFGDIVTPGPEEVRYPTLLDGPEIVIRSYPRYTLVSEKFEAMIRLGMVNSRMKDFFDIWILTKRHGFDGTILKEAIETTFARRDSVIPIGTPVALSPTFSEDEQKQQQWRAFVGKFNAQDAPDHLDDVVREIAEFLMPILSSEIESHERFEWVPGRGWTT